MKRRSRRNPSKKYLLSKSRNAIKASDLEIYSKSSFVTSGLKMLIPSIILIVALATAVVVMLVKNKDSKPASTVTASNSQSISNTPVVQQSTTPAPSETTPPEPIYMGIEMEDKSTIKYKATDERVAILQERLIELGYLYIDDSTTYFGPATQNAVKAFQRQHKLKITGNANTKTLTLMFSNDATEYCLQLGDEGDDINVIQEMLYELTYLDTKPTGYYGEKTVEAISKFQQNNNLPVTGIADRQTISMLYNPNAVAGELYAKKEKRSAKINLFIDYAENQLGKRYSLGSTGPDSFDCSGLVYYCLRKAGSSRRRLTASGYSQVNDWEKITSMSNLEIGDLLFFRSSAHSTRISHVGIYIGGGRMIDASTSLHRVVKRECKTSYWQRLFSHARRPW